MGKAIRWFKGLFGLKRGGRKEKDDSFSGDRKIKNPPDASTDWLIRSLYLENEQSRHAIAVAAATAAAADAAVAAAHAAVAVVRLTSQGGGAVPGAAVKIQSVFRGYLARKALRALKGLVKLQALVRGHLVRKQANATLRGIESLFRAQARFRARKSLSAVDHPHPHREFSRGFPPPPRKSTERFGDIYVSKVHSRRMSASFETNLHSIDEFPKIVQVDNGKPIKTKSRKSLGPSSKALSSPLPPSGGSEAHFQYQDLYEVNSGPMWEDCRSSSAQSTPKLGTFDGPKTRGTKSVCDEAIVFDKLNVFPNYMSNTSSSRAKLRSRSAPKMRPEFGPKRRVSLGDMMQSRGSYSGPKMERSCSQAQELIYLKTKW